MTLDALLRAIDAAVVHAIQDQFSGLVVQIDSDDGLRDEDFKRFALGLSRIVAAHERARKIAETVIP